MMKKDIRNKLVVKHNKLIEHKNRMTLNELKLFGLIVAEVREKQQNTLEKYRINISTLKDQTEHKDFYNYLKEVAFKIEEKSIEVEKLNDKGKRTSFKMRLIYRPEISEDSDYLELFLDKELVPYILDLKRDFTRYQLENILMLRSAYSVRIYELLKMSEYRGKREISVKELRGYLGIKEDEYKRFDNFEARVLVTAKKELNRKVNNKGEVIEEGTDIIIDYEKIKKGRRINSILFTIDSLHKNDTYINDVKELRREMGLEDEDFSSKQIIDIFELAVKRTQDGVDVYEYVKLNYLYIKGKAKNPYSYLMDSISNDYADATAQLRLNYSIFLSY